MAELVIGGIGALIGGSIGGTVLGMSAASFGWMVGSMAGSLITSSLIKQKPAPHQEGPRLDSLKVQSSAYGAPVARTYGAMRVAGNMIWATDLVEVSTEVGGGGGGGKKKRRKKGGGGGGGVTLYSYYANCAIGLSDVSAFAGPHFEVRRIWGDGKLIYQNGQQNKANAIRIYTGGEDQQPDPLIQAHEGVDNTPSYRGLCYIVFDMLALKDFGNRIPNITAEIIQKDANTSRMTVGDIIADQCILAGYTEDDLEISKLYDWDITGMLVQQPMPARNIIDQLQVYRPFDFVESNGKFRVIERHSTVDMVIQLDMVGAASGARDPGPTYELSRTGEWDLPQSVVISYLDQDHDYEAGAQEAKRLNVETVSTTKIDLAIAMSGRRARSIAEQRLYTGWTERGRVAFAVPYEFIELDPGDVVEIDGNIVRILEERVGDGLVSLSGVPMRQDTYSGEYYVDPPPPVPEYHQPVPSQAFVRDLPPLIDDDDDYGVYVMVGAVGTPWAGADVWSSFKRDQGYNYFCPGPNRVTFGTLLNNVAPTQTLFFDTLTTIDVKLSWGEFSEVMEDDVLNGANALLIDDEIIQFTQAEYRGGNVWRLSQLLRGRKGTEHAMVIHNKDSLVLLLDMNTMFRMSLDAIETGVTRYYKAVTDGLSLSAAEISEERLDGNSVIPLAPVHLKASRDAQDNLALSWTRRARIENEWLPNIDVQLDEPLERYEVEICEGRFGRVIRTATTNIPAYTYTVAQQIEDFGQTVSAVYARVYQISSRIGRGRPAEDFVGA